MKARISAVGHAIPKNKINNQYFVDKLKLDTSDTWIKERTGIETRYFCDETVATSDLGTEAAKNCISNTTSTTPIDLIITATSTPDYLSFPSTACLIQKNLNLSTPCPAFDLSAACSGFVYGVETAKSFIESGQHKKILIIGVDLLSRITNFEDRSTCILFADGAGAAMIEATDTDGILYSKCYAKGEEFDSLLLPEGGTKSPLTPQSLKSKSHYISMNGKAVFKSAISKITVAIQEALKTCNLTVHDVTALICHQANKRILDKIQQDLNIDHKKVIINVSKYGNTSAATIPLALSEHHQNNPFKKNDIIVLAGFGAGFTWGVTIIKWS